MSKKRSPQLEYYYRNRAARQAYQREYRRRKRDQDPAQILLANPSDVAGAQAVHDVTVMDDFMADIDRCAVALERLFHDLDGTVDPGAESVRRRDEQVERGFRVGHGNADMGS